MSSSSFDDLTEPVEGMPAEADRVGEQGQSAMQGGDSGEGVTDPDGALGTDPGDEGGGPGVQDPAPEEGNLDGSNTFNEPRADSLEQAGGNGSFDDASESSGASAGESAGDDAPMTDDGDSGQDNGLNE